MTKVTIDLSAIRNEITALENEAFQGLHTTDDKERRKILAIVVERIKTLRARMSADATSVEVK